MRFMTVAELRELVASGAIEVGAHTRSHAMLSARSPGQQRDEIGGSRADLERWLERPVTSFAYPFGARSSEYRAPAVRAVRAAGFESAVSTTRRHVDARSPLLELPRFPVADIPAEEFEVWLAGLLAPARSRRRPTRARLLRPLVERLSVPGRL
jgi:peptidoglycan/xylan/chitin deacetylase (PgdA/CDA1 family)